MMRFVMLGLALLMISNVPYPTVPSIGFRTFRQVMGTLVVVGSILGVIFLPREFFFPVLLGYVLFGIVQYAVIGILDRPATPTIFLEEEPPDPESIPMEAVAAIGPPERPPRPERPSGSERNRERRPDREPRPEREPREPREPKPDREGRPAPGAPDADEAEEARRRKRRRRGRKDRERGERPDRPDRGGTPETTDAGDRPAPPPPPSPPIQEPNE
jgi:hypothetical protein